MPLSSAGPSAGSADSRVRGEIKSNQIGVWGAEEGPGSPLAASVGAISPAPALARVAALAVGRVSGMLRPAAPVAGKDAALEPFAEREQGRRDDGRCPSLLRPKPSAPKEPPGVRPSGFSAAAAPPEGAVVACAGFRPAIVLNV